MLHSLRFSGFAALALVLAVSCTKSPSGKVYTSTNPMTFQQVVPQPTPVSNGSGTVEASYDQNTRLLSYTVRWQATDSATAIHVHGLGEAGFAAPIIQNVASGVPRRTSGSFSNTLLIDGIVLKEDELLSGRYYIDLHTKAYANAAAGGELRGQLEFNR
ncbi:CHRD domain-containing protein [Flaviaesturariibacter amylovorans]|uniref:CHRD domain-containing protein n=1 Tax=Flaviaesturariibacter amylovorans TaxID=1084520 RepID=A0ABP8H2U7_9BACT